ncbi:MAG: hypothetical protein EOO38_07730 [Cytophagaceae bacterium]|nr:MAG: hypothetical protein EOO38_07730 [Cytophagaceae bacterium]
MSGLGDDVRFQASPRGGLLAFRFGAAMLGNGHRRRARSRPVAESRAVRSEAACWSRTDVRVGCFAAGQLSGANPEKPDVRLDGDVWRFAITLFPQMIRSGILKSDLRTQIAFAPRAAW